MNLVVTSTAARVLSDPRAIPARVAAALLDDLQRIAADPYGNHPQAGRCGPSRASSGSDMATGAPRTSWIRGPTRCGCSG